MNTFTLNYICSISSILLFGMDKRNKKKKCGYINTPPSNRMERCYQLHPCLKISSTSYILTKLLSNLSEKKKKTLRECSCFLPFYARSTKCCILCSCYIQKLSGMLSLQKKKNKVRRTLRFIPIHCEEQKYKMYTSESQDNKQIILIQKHSPP